VGPPAERIATSSPACALPPGPPLWRVLRFATRPFEFLDGSARRHGTWFTVQVPGVAPFVFTSDPAAVQEVFAGDADLLHAGEANAPLGAFMGPASVLFLDGAAHLARRRLLLPPFHGERMTAYGSLIAALADRMIDGWPLGRPFALHPALNALAFEVILSAVFGFDEGPERDRLRAALTRLFDVVRAPLASLLGVPMLQRDLGPLSPWGRLVRARRDVERILFAELDRRRRGALDGRADVLSLLLVAHDEAGRPLSDDVVRDELLTFLLAGQDTTAASLAWAVWRLLLHPEVCGRLRDEVEDVPLERLGGLALLDAVVKETTRLDPVVPNVGRTLTADATIAGHRLPARTVVAPCIYLVHRRPDLWRDPERFDPDRFVATRPAPSVFFPFGGGVRRCLGAAFASHQMKVVLARIVARTNLATVAGYRATAVRRGIAFAPSSGLPVVLQRRR
jgi:cytochrome P450